MKKVWVHIRSRVITGVIFLIPVFAVLSIIQKIWTKLTGAGNYFIKLLGLNHLLGNNSVVVGTAILLIALFYVFGWLVRFRLLNKFREWIENNLLQYIPGYLTYRAQLHEKVNPKEDKRIPVFVDTADGKCPGLLVEEKTDDAIVFLPNSPDSNNGKVVLIAKSKITKIDMKAADFIKSMQKFGKDLVLVKS